MQITVELPEYVAEALVARAAERGEGLERHVAHELSQVAQRYIELRRTAGIPDAAHQADLAAAFRAFLCGTI